MNEATLYHRNFRLHLQQLAGYEEPVLIKELARDEPTQSHIAQLHNEYEVTRRLADLPGVRPAYALEGTESRPLLLLEYIQGQSLAELIRSTSLDMAEKLQLAVNMANILNRQVDYRTDLYSLGVILYELFTGQLPFESDDALEMIHAHIARQPQPPHQIDTGVPGPVSDIIIKLLAKNAEDRYQTAQGLQPNCTDRAKKWYPSGFRFTFKQLRISERHPRSHIK